MGDSPKIMIDPLSATSLRVELAANGRALSTASGFVVEKENEPYLITNWHVVAGRNPDTGTLLSDTGAIPDEIRIIHHVKSKLGSWRVVPQPLLVDGEKQWIEHPDGREVDVVALPLDLPDDVTVYPLDLGLADSPVLAQPAMPASIIGYPYGLATGMAWPIWKTGHIASDPDLNYDGRPAFLIDATTRGGMSGSPVILRLTGGFPQKEGGFVLAGGPVTTFLGVYSGRIHPDAEVGRVWRPHLVEEILLRASGG